MEYDYHVLNVESVFVSHQKYSRISLQEERRLIRHAKKGFKSAADELVLRHISFVIFRIHKRAFPAYVKRFCEDLLSQVIPILYQKIKTYNLRYYDKEGNFKHVRFVSYTWKFVDGLILASLKKEILNDIFKQQPDWDRFDHEEICSKRKYKTPPRLYIIPLENY